MIKAWSLMLFEFLATVKRKIAALLFNKGFRVGFLLLYRDMEQSAPHIRERTSAVFCDMCFEVVLKSVWDKRKQFRSYTEIRNYTFAWSLLLTEREIDRQKFFAKLLAFAWDKHNAGSYRIEPIPDFILILAQRYNTLEITNHVKIAANFSDRLMRDSFDQIRTTLNYDQEFSALWDELTAAILKHSSEQAL